MLRAARKEGYGLAAEKNYHPEGRADPHVEVPESGTHVTAGGYI